MSRRALLSPETLRYDAIAGVVVFLVALPLCLGVALASNAPVSSGILSGILGGLLVGAVSRSHTSVSGPSPGMTAVVAAQILALGSFEAFLLAVFIAGVIQIVLGVARVGFIAEFFPSSVIKGLLAAIGVILILKQIPHLVGHDADPEGEMAFRQPDMENTFSEFGEMLNDAHLGTALIGLSCLAILVFWDQFKTLKKSVIPAPLVVVTVGIMLSEFLQSSGDGWAIPASAFVSVPVTKNFEEMYSQLSRPDFSQWMNPGVYFAAIMIAAAASLETLLNLEAVDKIDPRQRRSPPSRELIAQGVGNVAAGLIGGIPISSVIVRSSVNINAGNRTKMAAIFHGLLLLICATLLPTLLNRIPVSCLAAILLMTGIKLASPAVFKQMWQQGRTQFLPFAVTVVAIVFTDLMVGVLIGLAVSIGFILHSNLSRPIHCTRERHLRGDVLHIELANQVSFLNRGALKLRLDELPRGESVLLDARQTDYIDPDIQGLLHDFTHTTAPARELSVSLVGFEGKFGLKDQLTDFDNSNRDLQRELTPADVLQILKDGNQRFRQGQRLIRDFNREMQTSALGQFPIAAVLSCIDSRSPAELIFDLGLGDIFSVRIAGHVAKEKVLASLEYACAVAGVKLIVVLGHTRCGAVTAAVDFYRSHQTAAEATGCDHLDVLVTEIQKSIDPLLESEFQQNGQTNPAGKAAYVDEVARRNVLRTMSLINQDSRSLARLVKEEKLAVVGGMYDIVSGEVDFLGVG